MKSEQSVPTSDWLDNLLVDFRNAVYPKGGVLTTEAQVRAALIVAFDAGRLFQFQRMKKKRPMDPIYWDMHEEEDLRKAAKCVSPAPEEGK
jgi:hypothetical protein